MAKIPGRATGALAPDLPGTTGARRAEPTRELSTERRVMKTMIIIALALAVVGCDRSDPTPTSGAESVPADNTRKNQRDRAPGAVTPGDQGNNDVDLGI